MATGRQRAPARETLAVWTIFGVVAAEIFATYARLPLRELYHVSETGPAAGLGRALVFLNFPTALVALPVLAIVAGRLWPVAVVAALLCCGVFWPGIVDQADLDAKWANAIPAAGVVIAVVLTVVRAREGLAPPRRMRGDRLRLGVALVLLVLSLPWLAADLGLSFGDMDAWWAPFGQARLHHAVHHGHHHGMDGTLLVLVALLLSRALTSVPGRLRRAVGVYLGILVAYGLGNILNDAWLEQLVKRGWVSFSMPSVLLPTLNLAWLAILVVGVLVGMLFLRASGDGVPARPRLIPSGAAAAVAVVALVVIGAVQGRQATAHTPFARSGSGTIVFPMSTEGPFHLYAIGADGRGLRQLTDEDASDLGPSWSPQGLLAFQSNRDDRGDVFVADANATAVERITGDGREGEPAWTSSGEEIVYVRNGDLYLAYAHGGGALKLIDDAAWPAPAPRTSLLAYETTRGSRHHIETEASDGDIERVRTGGLDSRRPAWSPDERLLAYECRFRMHWHICAFSPTAGTHWALTSGGSDEFAPAWSPDGKHIAFLSDRDGNDQLYVMRADGTGIVRLTTGQADKEAPAWRP